MINTLKYSKQLEGVGLTREQAETHIEIIGEIMDSNLATRQDLADLKSAASQDIADLKSATSQDIADLKSATSQNIADLKSATQQEFTEVRQEIKVLRIDLNHLREYLEQKIFQSEQRMVIKLGTIVSIAIGVAVTLTKLI
jgi:hypothetical protein